MRPTAIEIAAWRILLFTSLDYLPFLIAPYQLLSRLVPRFARIFFLGIAKAFWNHRHCRWFSLYNKAAAACAAPALKYFCSILHHNLAFTQNLGQTPLQLEVKALNDVGSVAQSTLCPSFQAIEYSCPEFGSLIFAIVSQ